MTKIPEKGSRITAGEEEGSYCSISTELQFRRVKRVLEMDVEAHRTIGMHLIPLHATLKNGKFCVMCLSPQFKNI